MATQPDRLLVVEDDAQHREKLSERLARRGYAVDVAPGDAALEQIRRAEYDLVLLDQTGTDGASLDLLRLLRAVRSPSDLPVILIAAEKNNCQVMEALRSGANDYVTKPVHLPLVAARIDEQLSRSKIGRQRRQARLRARIANRIEGHWSWDVAANEIHFSPRARRMLGLSPKQNGFGPEAWISRVHPADVERTRAEIRSHLEGPCEEFRLEHRARNRLGRYEWIVARGRVLRADDGSPIRVCGTTSVLSKPDVDALTGMGTRLLILERLGAAIAAQPAETALTLLLLDLDGFSLINDSFGQETGDRILTEIAERLQSVVADLPDRGATHIARLGGDEFSILAEGLSKARASALVEEVLQSVVRPMLVDGFKISASVSIGVSCGAPGGSSPEDLLRDAYLAMYRAKELGKNRWQMFDPELRTRARARIALVHDLRYAIERGQLRVYYQPKVHLRTRQILGYEALLRWHHPARGVVYPGEFIELAEDTGMIVPIGEWVLREACRQLRKWQGRFPSSPPLTMNVNLSVKQLVDPNLVERVKAMLEETNIIEGTLNLELTETALMTNLGPARAALADLRALKIRLKLDDFGTGYSSLGYLGAMHFDSLKIDRTFVQRMITDLESRAIVESIAKLAHALDMTLVAEGVEAEDHIHELLHVGCEVGQGFYFSTAVEPGAAEELLEQSLKAPIFERSRFRDGLS